MKKILILALAICSVFCMSSCLLCSGGHTDNNLNSVCDVCESVITVADIKPVGFVLEKFHFPDLSELKLNEQNHMERVPYEKYVSIDSDTEVIEGIKDTAAMSDEENGISITVRFESDESVDTEVFDSFDGDVYYPTSSSSVAIEISYEDIDIKAIKEISLTDNVEAIIIRAVKNGAIDD